MEADIEKLWREYLLAEQGQARHVMLLALDRFIDALLQQPAPIWHEWARTLAASVSDRGCDTPVRFPLFRRVLVPALSQGLRSGEPGCARWLASFVSLFAGEHADELTPDLQNPVALLKEALRLDPTDDCARRRLVDLRAARLRYTLHELPAGVLFGHDGATAEQCDELRELLEEFERDVSATSQEARFTALIEDCKYHFRAYGDYRRSGPLPGGYPEHLLRRGGLS